MTIIQEVAPTATTQCPPWCSGSAETHPDTEGETGHSCPVGELGVCVEQWGDAPVGVYVPELDVDSLIASAAFARQLGADLIAAAAVIEAATAKASAPCPDGLPWCTDHAWAPNDPVGWHRRYVGESGAHVCQEDGKFTLYPAPLSPDGDVTADEMRQAAADMIVAASMFEGMTA